MFPDSRVKGCRPSLTDGCDAQIHSGLREQCCLVLRPKVAIRPGTRGWITDGNAAIGAFAFAGMPNRAGATLGACERVRCWRASPKVVRLFTGELTRMCVYLALSSLCDWRVGLGFATRFGTV